ncbi:hypothetical protein N802_14185 [Knoellia sinensis KCTC 19936]|uniref:Uncharacterized protein n=1 Tax=Knoellia sinensis KCTC 19936 TaxID=1385520 RepID=A0A0A0J8U3_9MICO|nr:hypothetical protein [Knoellia sinensis]KGN33194.1 hypothetical protein N802_14185 [Knoellia sinensis KCTC 19936]
MDAEARVDAAVGSVAEEAARLLAALGRPAGGHNEPTPGSGPEAPTADGARGDDSADHAAGAGGAGPADTQAPGRDGHAQHVHVAMGDAETCTWCPVCRSISVLRGVSPETLARLADLATAAATVLTEMAGRHTESAGEARPGAPERTPRSEAITVVDEDDQS